MGDRTGNRQSVSVFFLVCVGAQDVAKGIVGLYFVPFFPVSGFPPMVSLLTVSMPVLFLGVSSRSVCLRAKDAAQNKLPFFSDIFLDFPSLSPPGTNQFFSNLHYHGFCTGYTPKYYSVLLMSLRRNHAVFASTLS